MPAVRITLTNLVAAAGSLFLSSCDSGEAPPPGGELLLAPPALRYSFEVRPLLAQRCFPCHGPDPGRNESGLRFDTAELAYAPIEGSERRAIVPGDPPASAVWQRINADRADQRMPPADAPHHLEDGERALIGRWISEGARYESHWAFAALPSEPPLPAIRNSSWPRNNIDPFILAAFEENFRPPPPASDPRDWLMRVTRALTGRPPTDREATSFREAIQANPEAAFAAAADELITSPTFGDTLATSWLATVQKHDPAGEPPPSADTLSFYRDWVAEAFNRNLPYDQFLREQVAGDLLEKPRTDQILATAFNRIHPLPITGDAGDAGALVGSASRRTETFGSSILGLSLAPARHRDHPVDPISRRDYLALLAFFNSIQENGRHSGNAAVVPAPTLPLPDSEQGERLYRATMQETDTENLLRQARLAGEPLFQAWLSDPDKLPVLSDLVGAYSFNQSGPHAANNALGGEGHADRGTLPSVPGLTGKAVSFDGTTPVVIADFFQAHRWNAWTFSLLLRDRERAAEPAVLLSRTTGSGASRHGLELSLAGGRITARIFRDWPGNAIGIQSSLAAVPKDQWALVTWTYDGSSRADGLRLYLNGRPLDTETLTDHLWKRALVSKGVEQPPILLGERPGMRGFANGLLDDLQVFSRALTPLEIAQLHNPAAITDALAAEATDTLRDYFFSSIHPESRRLTRRLETERRDTVLAEEPIREICIMRELAAPRPVFLPGSHTPLPRDTPAFLPPLRRTAPPAPGAESGPPTRLDLAAWLTRPDHPLTARVFVNRIWAHFFGAGLVATVDDFGLLSPAPSHPDLLDWLARDFINHGWDVKRLCRQIALSNAYRAELTPRSAAPGRAPR